MGKPVLLSDRLNDIANRTQGQNGDSRFYWKGYWEGFREAVRLCVQEHQQFENEKHTKHDR